MRLSLGLFVLGVQAAPQLLGLLGGLLLSHSLGLLVFGLPATTQAFEGLVTAKGDVRALFVERDRYPCLKSECSQVCLQLCRRDCQGSLQVPGRHLP